MRSSRTVSGSPGSATDEVDREPSQLLSHLILSLGYSGVDMGSLEKLAHQGLVEVSPEAAVRAVVAAVKQHPGALTIIFGTTITVPAARRRSA